MPFPSHKVKVAVPQLEPAWYDLDGGIAKSITAIETAAKEGAHLIVFSECWIPGYPQFIWGMEYEKTIPLARKYFENSVDVNSPQFFKVRNAAKDNKIYVLFGFSERYNGSLFMAQSLIDPAGEVLMHRHKTKPTHNERTIFGEGSGESIRNVVSTTIGNIGALQCWEHLQPLLKFHTYSQNKHFHIAAWPTNHEWQGSEPWSFSRDAGIIATRMYAMESGAYTLCATQCHTSRDESIGDSHMAQAGGGFSCIYGPDGRRLTEELPPDQEGIVYAECDFEGIRFAKSMADCVGHYSRPDLFQLRVDARRKNHVLYQDEEASNDMLARFRGLDAATKKGI